MKFRSYEVHPDDFEAYERWKRDRAPLREIDPYVEISLTAMAHGYFEPAPERKVVEEPHDQRSLTLDEIATGIPKQAWADPIDSMLKAKGEFLERSIEDILGMIGDRERMRDEHVNKIDKESCQAKTRIFEIDHWQPAMNREADRIRANQEKEMSGLERERRMEEIACWRDVSRMRMELHGVLEEWSKEKRKEQLLLGGR